MFRFVSRRLSKEQIRSVVLVCFVLALVAAVWTQRSSIADALGQLRAMPMWAIGVIVMLGATERVIRADIFRSLLGNPSFGCAMTVHDVGTAASKGLPMGGPVSTALRWSIARDASIPTSTFAVALIASGVASTFVCWFLPIAALSLDLTQRAANPSDIAVLVVCSVVLVGSIVFWSVVLGSERVRNWTARKLQWLCTRVGKRFPAVSALDAAGGVEDVRTALRSIAMRPWSLLGRSLVAQMTGSFVLLVALRGVGVGGELGTVEFFRVFFIVTLLGSFVPTPGGVGVIEAGLTGALVASGVAPSAALASVLVFRLVTYVTPIFVGGLLYVAWRARSQVTLHLPPALHLPPTLELVPSKVMHLHLMPEMSPDPSARPAMSA